MKKEILAEVKMTLLDKIGYGMGNMSYGLISQIIGFYIVFYSTSVLGISGKLVGLAVGLSILIDAIADPVMGYLSDVTKSKFFGRRHAYILWGGIALPITTVLLYSINPEWSGPIKYLLLLVLLIVARLFTTVYTTPYVALGSELSTDYVERTSIQGFKTMFFLIGIVSATGMGLALFFNPTEQFPNGQLNPQNYQNMALTVLFVSLFFSMSCFFTTFKHIKSLPKPSLIISKNHVKTILDNVLNAVKNSQYRYVVLGYLFTNISSEIVSTIGLHVYTYTFKLSNTQISFVLGVQFLVCILAQPVWVTISKRIDKKPTVQLGLLISVLGSVFFAFLVLFRVHIEGNVLIILPFAVLTGFGVAALFSLPLSMITDTIDLEELKTGERKEGVYFGLLTLAYKASQAAVIFLLGFLLDFVKFDSANVVQPASTVTVLGMTISVGSFLAFTLAMIVYHKYDLNAQKVSEIQKQIQIQKNEHN